MMPCHGCRNYTAKGRTHATPKMMTVNFSSLALDQDKAED
jgi:hypothetical protein